MGAVAPGTPLRRRHPASPAGALCAHHHAFRSFLFSPAAGPLGAGKSGCGPARPWRGGTHRPLFGSDPAPRARQFNIEFRVADATANPYLALAVLVQAGLDGIRRGLEIDTAGRPLPTSLMDALGYSRRVEAAAEWLGAELLSAIYFSRERKPRGCATWTKVRSAAAMRKLTEQPMKEPVNRHRAIPSAAKSRSSRPTPPCCSWTCRSTTAPGMAANTHT